MAERFYFDLVNGSESIPDAEGVEAGDLGEAVSQADEVLAAMRVRGELPDGAADWTLVVRDASGTVRHRLRLRGRPSDAAPRPTNAPSAPLN